MKIIQFLFLLVGFINTLNAAEMDLAKIAPVAEVQKYVSGATLTTRADGPTKLVYVDQKWSTMPLVTLQITSPKNVSAELQSVVKTAGMFGGKPAPVQGIGEEAFHEPQFNTLYFRKGGKLVVLGAAKDAGQIKVKNIELAKMIAGKL